MSIKVTAKSTVRAPVLHVGTASESMANDHDIVAGIIQRAPCLVRDWHILELSAAFEGEGWNNVFELVNFRRHDRDREIFIVVKKVHWHTVLSNVFNVIYRIDTCHGCIGLSREIRAGSPYYSLTPTMATRSMRDYDLHFHSADVQD